MKKRFYCDKCKRHLAWPLHICTGQSMIERRTPMKMVAFESLSGQMTQANMRLIGVQQKLDRAEKLLEKKFEETWEVLSHMSYKLDKLDRIERLLEKGVLLEPLKEGILLYKEEEKKK